MALPSYLEQALVDALKQAIFETPAGTKLIERVLEHKEMQAIMETVSKELAQKTQRKEIEQMVSDRIEQKFQGLAQKYLNEIDLEALFKPLVAAYLRDVAQALTSTFHESVKATLQENLQHLIDTKQYDLKLNVTIAPHVEIS